MRMVIHDLTLGGAVPVEVAVRCDGDRLTIVWKDSELILPADEVQAVMMGDDGK